jgi:putative DNA methylase
MELENARAYMDAVRTFLALAIDRLADFNCNLSSWKASGQQQMHLFTRQAIPMVWDYAEANILIDKAISWHTAVNLCADAIESLFGANVKSGASHHIDAANSAEGIGNLLVSTDPPYYDNIGYAALSDFFYVWLRRSLADLYPDIFSTILVPKSRELTASASRFDGDKTKAKVHFESGFKETFAQLRKRLDQRFPLTVYYAFKQEDEGGVSDTDTENNGIDLTTGWETLLDALISSGFTITATWPVRASQAWRMVAMNTNALASYIVLACRPRASEAPRVGRNAFVAELKRELPPALHHLQQGNVAPVDFAQAAIGPGMAVFSRYAAVLESSGKPMSVRTVLGIINGMKDELLGESVEDLDKDTRWAVQWFGEDGFEWGDSGKANLLANAQATSLTGLVADGILEVKGSNVRLIAPESLQADWDPEMDKRLTVWEMTHHLLRVYYHERKGDAATAALLRKLGTRADVARDLAYKLFTVCENRKWSREAQAYNSLVMGWPDLLRMSREILTETKTPVPIPGELF